MKKMKGVYKRGRGSVQAQVRVHGRLYSKTFPSTTSPDVIRLWKRATRDEALQAAPIPGSVAEAVEAYLGAVASMPTFDERKRHLDWWAQRLGRRTQIRAVTPVMIQSVIAAWTKEGHVVEHADGSTERRDLAPQTIRLRLNALAHMFRTLDRRAFNPASALNVPRPKSPAPAPRVIDPATASLILDSMPPSKTRARLRVIATTGVPHSTLMKVRPDDLQLDGDAPTARLQPRSKGRGAAGRVLPLSPAAVAAFREFIREDAFGSFSTSSMRGAFLRACKRVGVNGNLRPYDMRHLFGTLAYAASGDLATTARLLGHADPKTAARYAQAANSGLDAATMKAVGKAFESAKKAAKSARKSAESKLGRESVAR